MQDARPQADERQIENEQQDVAEKETGNHRPDKIGPLLKEIYAKRDDYVLYVKADKDLPYSKVIDAMDIASKNGVRVVGAVSDQLPGTKSSVEGDLLDTKKKP